MPKLSRGPFSHRRSQDFLWRCTFSPKSCRPFLVVVVTFKPTLNVQSFKRQNGRSKKWQLIPPPAAGAPPMVQPAQWLIRPWMVPLPQRYTVVVHVVTSYVCGWADAPAELRVVSDRSLRVFDPRISVHSRPVICMISLAARR